jgi:aldose 1-epimerase
MTVQVKPIEYLGEPAVTLRTAELEAIVVPGWGSNMIAMTRVSDGLEILHSPGSREEYLARPALFGNPVLFPPNRIDGGQFQFNGRTYHFPINHPHMNNHIHGVLMRLPWQLRKAETDGNRAIVETFVDSEQSPDVFEALPHRFTVTLRFVAEGGTLTQQFIVTNHDEAPLPVGLGYHTSFRFPLAPEGSLERCTFQLHADKQWELNDRFLPTGEFTEIPYKENLARGMTMTGIKLDNVFSSAPGYANKAVITDPDADIRIVYSCDDTFQHWVVYNGDGQSGFLCPEPYTWVTNAPNLDLPHDVTGFRAVAPGDTTTFSSSISLQSL